MENIIWIQRRGQIKHLLYELCLTGRIDRATLADQFKDLNNVTPVVRCKDCKYNYANMIPGGKGCQQNVYIEVDDNFFCADGEQMDEVEE